MASLKAYAVATTQIADSDITIAITSSGIAIQASFTPSDLPSRMRICNPPNAPRIAATPPRMQKDKLLFVAASKHTAANEPVRILEINPGAAVRFGVFGRRSQTYSPIARNENPATNTGDDINEKGVSARFRQPRYAHHATTASGVSPRNPAANPMRATLRINDGFIGSSAGGAARLTADDGDHFYIWFKLLVGIDNPLHPRLTTEELSKRRV